MSVECDEGKDEGKTNENKDSTTLLPSSSSHMMTVQRGRNSRVNPWVLVIMLSKNSILNSGP